MSVRVVNGFNIVAYLLYLGLVGLGCYGWLLCALSFAMATDGCHDAACEAGYHEEAALATVSVGILGVLALTGIVMLIGTAKSRIVIGWPILGLAGFAGVYFAGLAVLH